MKETLYKIIGDKVQQWTIEVDGDKYRVIEGFEDGALTESAWTIAKPKNIGKANATTGAEQAIKEAKAKVQKKLDKFYVADKADLELTRPFTVMLAHKYEDHKKKISYPMYCQPKLDGMRCYINSSGMFSRENKPVVSAPHIMEAVRPLFARYPGLILDGELYNHELKEDFNTLISLVKKTKPTPQELIESKDKIQYHIYDMQLDRMSDLTFEHRIRKITDILIDADMDCVPCIELVETQKVHNPDTLDVYYAKFLEQGYEGQMVRADDVPYEEKRSYSLLKRKEFIDEEFEIVDILEGDGNRAGMMGRIVLKLKDRRTFNANAKGNNAYYTELLVNKEYYIGKQATLKFQNFTPDGIPRFGVVTAIRDYE